MVGVKICGLTRQADAELAVELGAFAVGFVFEPTSRRYVGSPDWSPAWLSSLGGCQVGVYGLAPSTGVPAWCDLVQAVEWPDDGPVRQNGAHAIRVLRPVPEAPIAESLPKLDAFSWFLLDAFDSGAFGGTGKTIDWGFAAELVREMRVQAPEFGVKVGLAGGLTPENVARAVEAVQPDYVDVASGVESSPGIKDPVKLRAFFRALGR